MNRKRGVYVRVITGKYKKRRIETLEHKDTRPTSEKVRESMFSAIGERVSGDVLDLFAGSGALGIEALSRGGERCIFVDGAKDAIRIIHNNTKGLDEPVEIYRNDFRRALKALSKRNRQMDLIFLDPPYNKKLIDEALHLIKTYDILKKDGIIIVEAGANETIDLNGFVELKHNEVGTIQYKVLTTEENYD
ncbi:16S rRNA (guanine(966)-N(2))-methyltransferase RsmD [Nosocomiicoccus massiliensis]|uniref:16S rRNA (guanine(966)-N(2))-methyltransferase RsmD n=1 Tax=Nosocomiicoccus massiliensis TaxID=1232430 RepID=UPI0009DBB65F